MRSVKNYLLPSIVIVAKGPDRSRTPFGSTATFCSKIIGAEIFRETPEAMETDPWITTGISRMTVEPWENGMMKNMKVRV